MRGTLVRVRIFVCLCLTCLAHASGSAIAFTTSRGLHDVKASKVDNPYFITSLLRHLYLSGRWFGVASKMDTKNAHV